jgi:hypothetical protein
MTDVDNEYDQTPMLYLIDDSVVSYANALEVVGSSQFLRIGRMRRDG